MTDCTRSGRQPPSVFDGTESEGLVVTLDDAADCLGVQRGELQRSVEEGEIPYYCVGSEIRFDMAEIGEWIKRRPVIVPDPQTAPGRATGLDQAGQTRASACAEELVERETIDRNSPKEQARELPMAWGELWIDKLYAGHRRTIVVAFDDFASLVVGHEPTASRRSVLFGWLATASDEEFAESSCTYLEQLLEDPEQSVDQISYLMKLLGRARSDAQRELAPALAS